MSRHRSQSFSKQSQTQLREKADRHGGSGSAGSAQGVVYEPLIFRSLLSARWRFSSTQGLKSTSDDPRPRMRSPRDRGDQGQGQGPTLREAASTSRLSATAPPEVPLRTSSRSHLRAREGSPDEVPVGETTATVPEQNGSGARRRKESLSAKARPKESSISSTDSASSVKETSKVAKQKLKLSSPPSRPSRRTASTPPAGAGNEDEPKSGTPEPAGTTPAKADLIESLEIPGAGLPSSTARPPGTEKSPSKAEEHGATNLTTGTGTSEQTEASAGLESSATPNKPAPADSPGGAEPSSREPPETMQAPATQDSVTRDSVTRDSVTRDSVTRDSVTQDVVTQDVVTQDVVTQALAKEVAPASEEPRVTAEKPSEPDCARQMVNFISPDCPGEPKLATGPASPTATKPRPPSASATTIRFLGKKPKGAKCVRFGVETTRRIEVHPSRHLRPLSSANFGTRSGLSYLDSSVDPRKAADKAVLEFPEGKLGTKLRRRRERQAAVARYWLRTEEEEAAERARATVRAEEEAAKYRQEPSSPGSETVSPVMVLTVQIDLTWPRKTGDTAKDDDVGLVGAAAPDAASAPAVPQAVDTQDVACAGSRQEATPTESDVPSKAKQELARIKEELARNQDDSQKVAEAAVPGDHEREGRKRKPKMRPLVFP